MAMMNYEMTIQKDCLSESQLNQIKEILDTAFIFSITVDEYSSFWEITGDQYDFLGWFIHLGWSPKQLQQGLTELVLEKINN